MSGDQEVDLAHIHWYSPEWIYALPTKTLSTPEEAMDYFALSPFFDPLSNNNNLRVQRMVTDPFYGYAKAQYELPRYVSGFEYVPAHMHPPDLFVIHRREIADKGSRNNVTGMWFILEGKVYPSPNVYDTMATRLKNASFLISQTFASLASAHPPSNPRAHSVWRSLPPDMPQPTEDALDDKAQTQGDESAITPVAAQTNIPNFALLNALQSTRNSIAELSSLAQKPAPRIDPVEELKRIEEEMLGPTSAQVATGARSIRSASVVPTHRDRTTSNAGTPAFRLLGPRTPGVVPATSPLSSTHYIP